MGVKSKASNPIDTDLTGYVPMPVLLVYGFYSGSVPTPLLTIFFYLILSASAFLLSYIGSDYYSVPFITVSGLGGINLDYKSAVNFFIA